MLKYILDDLFKTAFFNQWNYFNLWTEQKSVITDTWTWHLRLEHVRFQTLEYLVNDFKNVWIQRREKDSITVNCDNYAAEKISWRIHHKLWFNEEDSEECLAIDFHDFKQDFRDWTSLIIITDCWSDFIWDFYLSSYTSEIIIKLLTFFFDFL